MTSPANVDPGVEPGDGTDQTGPDAGSPWSGRNSKPDQKSRPGNDQLLRAAQQPGSATTDPGTPQPGTTTPGTSPAPGSNTPATTAPGTTAPGTTAPGSAAPGTLPPSGTTTPGGTPAPGTTPPVTSTQPGPAHLSPPAHDSPGNDLIDQLAPAAMQAVPTALMMLPLLATALSGLGGNNNSNTTTPQQNTNPLTGLAGTYGNGNTTTPTTSTLQTPTTSSSTGSDTGIAIQYRQLYQHTVATAFNNLDNQLYHFITNLAGNHTIDKTAVLQLLRDTDTQLAQLGPAAYTTTGQQQVHQILTTAITKAEHITTTSTTTATQTANEINQLTNQYIYNLAGKNYTMPGGAGASPQAQEAIRIALSEVGKPYVWGGSGPDVFDCSGLTSYAARAAGVNIPRTAAEQYQELPKVNPADIQPGDLIFPAAEFNDGSPGHVMMYIGNGRCVEAPHTGADVQVIPLPSSFHASRWT